MKERQMILRTNTKKNYDRKIWLFDFCEGLARVSGKGNVPNVDGISFIPSAGRQKN
jgi:hypothetical protein